MQFFLHTEPGYGHGNEDVVQVRPLADKAEMLLCALADGQGGQSGGAEAARIAVQSGLSSAANLPDALLNARTWRGIVQSADETVESARSAGYTTLICLGLTEDKVVGASCGDSTAILFSDGQQQVLTERQYKNPPVGSSAAQAVSFSATLGNDWKLLVMSDGVWKYVGWERIEEFARQWEGENLITALRQAAASGWGGKLPDDFTIALFQSTPG